MRYRHRYRIEENYFLRMAMAREWQVAPIHGVYFICEVPGRRGLGWRVVDTCIGIYGPVSGCFHTNRVPARPDPRVVPWCDCCWVP